MRRILVERARSKRRIKHGGRQKQLEIDSAELAAEQPCDDLLVLDEALAKLTEEEPLKADIVKLRYFAGLTATESAQALNISKATADRYWAYARAWLFDEMNRSEPPMDS